MYSGILGDAQQQSLMQNQSPLHQLGGASREAGTAAGGAKPRGGQNAGNQAGRVARNSGTAGASDAVADINASSTPTPISAPTHLFGCPICDDDCPKKFPPAMFIFWLQSNFGPGQNALGGLVDPAKYTMDPAAVYAWNLPTSDDPEVLVPALLPFGLTRYQVGPGDFYGVAWAQARAGGSISVCVGAWNVAARTLAWSTNFGLSIGGTYTNPPPPLACRFFHESIGHWMFCLPSQSGSTTPTIYSAKSADLHGHQTLDKNMHNASIHSFAELVASVLTTRIYLCLPYTQAGPVAGQSIDFWLFDEGAKSWGLEAGMAIEDVPEGGSAAVPDLIENGTGFGSPVPWLNNEAVVFVSGGTKDALDATKWTDVHWTIRSIKPDGTAGALLQSKTVTATDSPTVLSPASMKTEASAAAYPLQWNWTSGSWHTGTGHWSGGSIELASDASASFESFDAPPIALPAATANTARLLSLGDRFAKSISGTRQWPTEVVNTGGGVLVDEAGTVWSCVLEPDQVLAGGYYTTEVVGTVATYRWGEDRRNCGWWSSGAGAFIEYGFSPTSTVERYGLTGLVTASPDSPFYETGDCYDVDNVLHENVASYSLYVEYLGTRDQYGYVWNQRSATKWKTILRGFKADTTVIEHDISQLLDATHSAYLGFDPGSHSTTVTQSDFEAPDNVWQMVSFADKGILAILRDLHADGAGKNPTPHLEIWDVSGTPARLSTVRLGSYTEKKSSDNTSFTPHWEAGDQEWDPYAFGPPRMKACRKAGTDNVPVLVAMVGENKKVNTATQSRFKRVCYATIDLTNPSAPDVVRSARTSEDLGVGNSGEPTGEDFFGPLWAHWDTLLLTPGHVAWIRDSELRETSL